MRDSIREFYYQQIQVGMHADERGAGGHGIAVERQISDTA